MNHPRVVGVERDMKMIEGRVEVSSFRVPHHLEGRRRLLVWRACFGTRQFFESALETLEIAVWPEAPVRQWVLSLPPGVRYLLAWRHDLCTAVAGSYH